MTKSHVISNCTSNNFVKVINICFEPFERTSFAVHMCKRTIKIAKNYIFKICIKDRWSDDQFLLWSVFKNSGVCTCINQTSIILPHLSDHIFTDFLLTKIITSDGFIKSNIKFLDSEISLVLNVFSKSIDVRCFQVSLVNDNT